MGRAGLTVVAVHAPAGHMDGISGTENMGIAPFLYGRIIIFGCCQHLVHRMTAHDDHLHAVAVQAVLDALGDRQGHAERRTFRFQQRTRAQRLHHGNGHTSRFTGGVQPLPRFIHHQAAFFHALELHQVVNVRLGTFHIIGGIDAEHQHIHDAALHGFQGNVGVVGAHADVADHAVLFQFPGVGQHRPLKDRAEVLLTVHIVDHTHINIVGMQAFQQVCKGAFCFFDIPGTGILSVFKDGAQMSLNDKLLPASLQGKAQISAGGSLGHENIDVIDAFFLRSVYNGAALPGGQAVEPLAAQTDLADTQSGAAQCPVFHAVLLSVLSSCKMIGIRYTCIISVWIYCNKYAHFS